MNDDRDRARDFLHRWDVWDRDREDDLVLEFQRVRERGAMEAIHQMEVLWKRIGQEMGQLLKLLGG